MVDTPDLRMYEMGFNEGIRTALNIFESKGYDRALKALKRMLENSQSRPPEILRDQGGHDTTRTEA
jgi:hypothetical protein